jgi:BirA family transcriptional regulator, biotin operon repressor / biotin---[acetyl-CoA-carboxylase] ligase
MRIVRCERIGSTQDQARKLLGGGDPVPFVVVAASQDEARGRRGRAWISPEGGLYASLAVPYDPLLPLRLGVAVVRAARRYGVEAVLKWPNDVLVGERKLAGILIEREAEAAIAGVGVNLGPVDVDGATSLAQEGGRPASPEAFLEALLAVFEAAESDVLPAYRELLATLGRTVRIERGGPSGALVGTAVDVDAAGRLRVRHDETIETVSAGDCVHLREVED